MEPSQKNKVDELHKRIGQLERDLARASSKSKRLKIRRKLKVRREEVGRALDHQPKEALGKTLEQAPSASMKRLPYVSKCTKMDFRELRQFIDDSLRELPAPGFNEERPRSKEEFLVLWEMLCGKIDEVALPTIITASVKPDFPSFAPSEQLKPLLDQREHLTSVLATVRSDPSTTKRSIKKRERELRLLEQDIVPLESRERQDYAKRRDAHFHPYWEAEAGSQA